MVAHIDTADGTGVASFGLAPEGMGGRGATVVELKA